MTLGGKTKVVGRDVTVREVIDEVLKDRIYFRRSGGGLTLSGGESLLQADFAAALLAAAKENGLTTAIESTGFAPFSTIQKILQSHRHTTLNQGHRKYLQYRPLLLSPYLLLS